MLRAAIFSAMIALCEGDSGRKKKRQTLAVLATSPRQKQVQFAEFWTLSKAENHVQ
jgi:hypothetical protein